GPLDVVEEVFPRALEEGLELRDGRVRCPTQLGERLGHGCSPWERTRADGCRERSSEILCPAAPHNCFASHAKLHFAEFSKLTLRFRGPFSDYHRRARIPESHRPSFNGIFGGQRLRTPATTR